MIVLFNFTLLSNCTKGPTVTDIVKGIYKKETIKNKYKSIKIKVLTGDTLKSLSKKNQVTVKELIKFNKIKPPYIIKPGKFIKIPVAKKYKIKKGDTLYYIANCHQIKIEEIKAKNSKIVDKKLLVNRYIKLPYYVSNKCNNQRTRKKSYKNSKADTVNSVGIFNWPVNGIITAKFGKQKGGRRNDGINILSAKGNPVRAALNGIVIYRGNELPAWGNLILIKHKNNWTTAYAHLESFLVDKGEIVKTGDVIGSIGSTGNVLENQLHFQVRKNSKPLDPMKFLKKP